MSNKTNFYILGSVVVVVVAVVVVIVVVVERFVVVVDTVAKNERYHDVKFCLI